MTFNEEQFQTLAKYEGYFKTAVEASWCRYPGRAALVTVHAILKDATGDRRRLNTSCGVCTLNLMRDAGRIYFADKQERIDAQNDRTAVELSQKAAKPRKKVTVKTEAEK
ncbi:MAG: hypothetical protein IJ654_05390 [Bacteroidales bacterium]|nr:hypothetical protein [Bacteroidales bacterium]